MNSKEPEFPQNWRIGQDYDPNEHLMQLKGRQYLNVQNRLLWFIRDQRALIAGGLSRTPYIVQSDLVELDREQGWAHFKTFVRDVLGNEATMFGSESARDFPDYVEKASTKSLGRALLALGYGTAFAPEIDEGDRVVDSPVDTSQRQVHQARNGAGRAMQEPAVHQAPRADEDTVGSSSATEQQMTGIRKLCEKLNVPLPSNPLSRKQARELLTQLNAEFQRSQRAS